MDAVKRKIIGMTTGAGCGLGGMLATPPCAGVGCAACFGCAGVGVGLAILLAAKKIASPWSGHSVIMGKDELDGQKADEALSLFGWGKESARRSYRQFVIDGITKGRRDELVCGGLRRSSAGDEEAGDLQAHDARILGSGEFVEGLWQEVETPFLPGPVITCDNPCGTYPPGRWKP